MLVIGLLLAGCGMMQKSGSRHYAVTINALTDGRAGRSTVQLINITETSHLEKKYYDDYARAAMTAAGYKVVETQGEAELVVLFSYGISSREKIASRPTYSWVAPKTYNYTANSFGSYGNTYSSGTVSEGGIGHLSHSGNEVYSYDEYTRTVHFEAYLAKDIPSSLKLKQNPPETWRLTLASAGYSEDLRKAFPYLMTAALNFFDSDSSGQQKRFIYHPSELLTKTYTGGVEVRDPANSR